jgi:putative membrane protein
MVMHITDNDRTRLAEAIAAAERQTSGEIFCVVARRLDLCGRQPGLGGGDGAFLPRSSSFRSGLDLRWPGDGWEAAHQAAQDATTAQALGLYALSQAVVFVGVFLLTRIPPVRRFATPAGVRRGRVREAALQQFWPMASMSRRSARAC